MSDEQPKTDAAGIARTADGTIATPTTEPPKAAEPTTPTPTSAATEEPKEGKTLLSQDEPKAGAPETYADFKLPEGYELDKEVAAEAGGLFKGMNLSQVDAQKLVDFYFKQTQEAFEAPFKTYADTRQGWREEAAKHPE